MAHAPCFLIKKRWSPFEKRWALIEREDSLRANDVYFGGSFNPIHNGHILLVQHLLEYGWVRRCLIVPTGASPFKEGQKEYQSFNRRLSWVEKAFEDMERVSILRLEAPYRDEDGRVRSVFYTNETLERFYRSNGYYPYLGIGSDALGSFNRWKDWQALLKKTKIVVFGRKTEFPPSGNEAWLAAYRHRIYRLDTPVFEISSTCIRERAFAGKSLRGFVPYSIEKEIGESYRERALHDPDSSTPS